MVKVEKTVTKDALIGMQVIDAEGHAVGNVKDVAFTIGKAGISLNVENKKGDIRNVAWEEIQASGDYVILKPVLLAEETAPAMPAQTASTTEAAAKPGSTTPPICPTCKNPLTYIPQYQRWYCYKDQKYV
jgi:sporulation protein YlmC with PRC-barrel domain